MNRLGKKGYGALGFILLYFFLLLMWPLVFAHMFTVAGQNAVASGATGIDAFFWTNLNLWFFLCMVVVAIIYLRYGGGE